MTGSIALRSACLYVTTRSGRPLALRRPHVVLAQRVEHARPHEPRVTRDVDDDEGDDRQDQVLPDVEERRRAGCRRSTTQYASVPNGGEIASLDHAAGRQDVQARTAKMKMSMIPSQNVGIA